MSAPVKAALAAGVLGFGILDRAPGDQLGPFYELAMREEGWDAGVGKPALTIRRHPPLSASTYGIAVQPDRPIPHLGGRGGVGIMP